ncbi:MAG: caspase family protein, partial [Cyclobacteriaceae bacterium]
KNVLKTFKGHLGEITSLRFSKDDKQAVSTATEGKEITWELSTGTKVSSGTTDFKPLKSTINNSEIAYNKLSATLTSAGKSVELPHFNRVTSFGFTPDEKYAYTASPGGSLNLWHPQTGKWLAKIMITKAEELVGINADYYFMASPSALNSIAFRYDNKMYPFEQFDLKYNRPDLFLKSIGYADKELVSAFRKAYAKRMRQSGKQLSEKDLFTAPKLSLDYSSIDRSAVQADYQFKVKATGSELKTLLISVNGVPAGKVEIAGTEVEIPAEIRLSEGLNLVEVAVENAKNIRSLTQNFEVRYLPQLPVRKDLYLVTIGVSEYSESDFNLTYAAKDAQDIANVLKKQAGQYEQIHHISLLNEKVTSEAIKSLGSKLSGAGTDDQIIFFFAGHGLLSADLDYYLAAYNTNFEKPEEGGIPYESIEELLAKSPARNKLVMIDACHSGEVDKENTEVAATENNILEANLVFRGFKTVKNRELGMKNTFQLMKSTFADLRDNTGTIVISSAGGAEYALESDQWSNGVFTYFMKEGLVNEKADLDGNGKIYAGELQQYVAKQVSLATDGKQQPTMRVKNLKNDMVVWQ